MKDGKYIQVRFEDNARVEYMVSKIHNNNILVKKLSDLEKGIDKEKILIMVDVREIIEID